jgi:hypothetical protein
VSERTERNVCPDDYRQRLVDIGGVNRYDEPNFRFCWGQTDCFRAGGVWEIPDQPTYRGYRDLLVGMGERCWILQQWYSPEHYGTPCSYYVENFDETTGYQTLGEYPYKGRYETVFPLVWRGIVNGRLVTEHMPLSNFLIDTVVPIILLSRDISLLKRRAVFEDRREREKRAQESQIESALADAYPRLGEIRSSAHLACNSVIQKKVAEIERHWRGAVNTIRSRPKGLSVC